MFHHADNESDCSSVQSNLSLLWAYMSEGIFFTFLLITDPDKPMFVMPK